MTAIVIPTTIGTIKANTLGNFIFQLAQWGLTQQKSTTKNPNALDYLSISIDNEVEYDTYPTANGGAATIAVAFPCGILALPPTSDKTLNIPDYLTNSGYDAGSGGTPTFNNTSWAESLAEAIILMHLLQNNAAKNPLNIKPVSSWAVSSDNNTGSVLNGQFSSSIELPLIQSIETATGNLIISGASPMGSLS